MSKVVFARIAAIAAGSLPTTVIGLTRGAFDAIASGKTHDIQIIDAEGFAHNLVLFGAETAAEASRLLEGLASRAGSVTGENALGVDPEPEKKAPEPAEETAS
jgi:hypothetical protein